MTPQRILASRWSAMMTASVMYSPLTSSPVPNSVGVSPQIKLPACKPSVSSSFFSGKPEPRQLLLPSPHQLAGVVKLSLRHVWQFCGQTREFLLPLSQLEPRRLDGMNSSECHAGRGLLASAFHRINVELFCKQNLTQRVFGIRSCSLKNLLYLLRIPCADL